MNKNLTLAALTFLLIVGIASLLPNYSPTRMVADDVIWHQGNFIVICDTDTDCLEKNPHVEAY